MSDLAPLVAAALRDKTVLELMEENKKLKESNKKTLFEKEAWNKCAQLCLNDGFLLTYGKDSSDQTSELLFQLKLGETIMDNTAEFDKMHTMLSGEAENIIDADEMRFMRKAQLVPSSSTRIFEAHTAAEPCPGSRWMRIPIPESHAIGRPVIKLEAFGVDVKMFIPPFLGPEKKPVFDVVAAFLPSFYGNYTVFLWARRVSKTVLEISETGYLFGNSQALMDKMIADGRATSMLLTSGEIVHLPGRIDAAVVREDELETQSGGSSLDEQSSEDSYSGDEGVVSDTQPEFLNSFPGRVSNTVLEISESGLVFATPDNDEYETESGGVSSSDEEEMEDTESTDPRDVEEVRELVERVKRNHELIFSRLRYYENRYGPVEDTDGTRVESARGPASRP